MNEIAATENCENENNLAGKQIGLKKEQKSNEENFDKYELGKMLWIKFNMMMIRNKQRLVKNLKR